MADGNSKHSENVEAFRRHPTMLFGPSLDEGLHHAVDDFIQVALLGVSGARCDQITVILGRDGSITITGNGPGFPVKNDGSSGEGTLQELLDPQRIFCCGQRDIPAGD